MQFFREDQTFFFLSGCGECDLSKIESQTSAVFREQSRYFMNHSYTKTFKTLQTSFQEKFAPIQGIIRKSCGSDHLKWKKFDTARCFKDDAYDPHLLQCRWRFLCKAIEAMFYGNCNPCVILENLPIDRESRCLGLALWFFGLTGNSCLEFAAGSL